MGDCLAGLVEAFRAFGSTKELARAGGVSMETANRYRTGRTVPDLLTLARLMRNSRAVADAVLRLAGLDELSLDLEQARLVRALADLEQRRIAAHEALERARAPHRAAPRRGGSAAGDAGVPASQTSRRPGEAS
jgi:transcriptional regulator with XRE-family HTH domain